MISGLGADRRMFRYIHPGEGFSIHHIDWLQPLRGEPFRNYCQRMADVIDKGEPYILVGLSFGGIVAVEISRFLDPEKVIVISSIATRSQLPRRYRIMGAARLQKVIPPAWFRRPNYFLYKVFGAETDEEKNLLREYVSNINPYYLKWSLNVILQWDNETPPAKLFHIHGTKDIIFPVSNVKADAVVKDGKHFMILSKEAEINQIIQKELHRIDKILNT
jgi:pimeloyl-ACP methyl ester carboxylesterase